MLFYQVSRKCLPCRKSRNCDNDDDFSSWIPFFWRLIMHMCCQSAAPRPLISNYFRASPGPVHHESLRSIRIHIHIHTQKHTQYLLLSLDGVHWSHVITGNVAAATSSEGTSIPPIPFTEREKERKEKNRGNTLQHFISYYISWHFLCH